MVKKFVCLFVMTMAMLLSSQTKAQDSAQRLVDLTAKSGKTTQKGLRKIKTQPSKKLSLVATQDGAVTKQKLIADKKREAVSVSKQKEKQESVLKRRAHKPTTQKTLHRQNAPRLVGEVVNENGVIVKPAEGVRKVYRRSGQALAYDPDGESWLLTEQEGQVNIVFCDDGTVYIKNLISTYISGSWVKGSLSGNTISIPTGQLVSYESNYGIPFAIYWGRREGRDFFKNEEKEVITFTINDDVISLDGSDEDNIIGVFYEQDKFAFFDNFGDYESVYTYDHDYVPLDVVTVTPPADLQTETWYTKGHTYEGSSVAFRGQIEIGFDGNDVYLHGMFSDFPDAWMHGAIDGETVTFNGLQVQGEQDGSSVYAIGYDGETLRSFEMNYDAEGGVLTSAFDLLANMSDEESYAYAWIEDITISREDPFKPIENYPYLNTFQTLDEQEAFTVIDENEDRSTWDFAYNSDDNWFARYTYNETFEADDWLISPAFHFEADKQYVLTFDTWNKAYDERIEVMVGTEAASETMSIQVVEPTDVVWEEPHGMEAKISVSESGTYYIGFHAISDADRNKIFVDNVQVDIFDLEAPAAPADFTAVQTEEKMEVTVSFTAPVAKRNGEALMTNLEKIELMRDNEVIHSFENVAPGEAITWVDNGEDLTLGIHNYYAVAYNDKGAGDKSEEVSLKIVTTLHVPYTADLTQPGTMSVFTVIDANDDACTWNWDDSYHTNYVFNTDNEGDDYLVTLPILLEAGKNYYVSINAYNGGIVERFEVMLGKEPTAEALTTTLIAPTEVTTDDEQGEEYESLFSVDETGLYYVAIHAISDADKFHLIVNNLSIVDGAQPKAPAAPTISAVADELAALKATVTVTTSKFAVDESSLSSNLTRVELLRDGQIVGSFMDVAPGEAVVFEDEPEEFGFHVYQAISYNEFGKGLKSEKLSIYVGPDIPVAVQNLTAIDGGDVVSLQWNKVGNTGENGGVVNPATVNYSVWSTTAEETWGGFYVMKDQKLAQLTDADSFDVPFNTDEGEQRMEYWIVETTNEANAEMEGNTEVVGLLVGAPYQLPLVEGFADLELHYYWETNGTVMIAGQSTDGDGSSMALLSEQEGVVYFTSGKLDLEGLKNPTLVFDVASPDIKSLTVVGSTDGGVFGILKDNIAVSDDFTQVKVPLSLLQGGRYAQIGFLADFDAVSEIDPWEGNVTELGDMLIVDNIHITDFYQNDLAIEVAAPQSVVAGKSASVSVIVSNEGENVASGFTVQLTAGEEELLSVTPKQSLASFESWTYNYNFKTSILDEAGDKEIVVRVIYDKDEKAENNEAQTVISILEPMAPVPSDLVVEKHDSNLSLSWTAPDMDGVIRVTEDFEDTNTFPEFSLGGITETNHSGALGDWTLYDGNGVECYSFSDFDVPNLGNPMAWMVFKPAYLSKEIGEAYAAHSGSQLLLSTCVADGDPIPATDHWLISPELKGNEQNISFFIRVITDSYGDESFDVLYSTTDAEVSSFEVLDNLWLSATEWTECNYTLPEGTKYFAIRHSSTDIFGLLLDDITFERSAMAPVGYNIYVDGEKVGSATDTAFDMSNVDLTSGEHSVAVTAIYAGGVESSPATTVLDITTGIDVITLMGEPVDVYTTDGRLIRRQATNLDGLKGMYMIGNKKVFVK